MAGRRGLTPAALPDDSPGGYDRDVVVVGAGPAGIAAAIRLRWLKGYEAIPASVALVDPDPPGGLAALGGCVLTGPGWATNAEGILTRLEPDLLDLEVPWLQARATGITREGPLFRVALSDGREVTSRAVIVATGFRALHGEVDWFRRGVSIMYKGYGFFEGLVVGCATEAAGRGLVVIGHRDTLELMALVAPHAATAGGVQLLLQPPCEVPETLPPGVTVRVGVSRGYVGSERVTGVRFETPDGAAGEIACGAALVDYHAFERAPERPSASSGAVLPERDARGFVAVDARMATSVEGLWAAGDVTGRYASTVMALGDGVCAAFAAYEWLHDQKFGRPPSLYAYAATGPLPDRGESPARFPLGGHEIVVHLHSDAPGELVHGASVARLRQQLGEDVDDRIFNALFQRTITLHPPI